jgi:hypothetical protein
MLDLDRGVELDSPRQIEKLEDLAPPQRWWIVERQRAIRASADLAPGVVDAAILGEEDHAGISAERRR